MSNINDLVVSLETAKKLKEAGWNKETEFWWNFTNSQKDGAHSFLENAKEHRYTIQWRKPAVGNAQWDIYPAPTLSELLEEMPETIITENETWGINLTRKDGLCMAMYAYYDKDKKQQVTRPSYVYVNENSAECMARLYLILKSKELI